MSSLTLLDLPFETFLDISDGLDESSLSRVASTCRHLHEVALSIITKRHIRHLQSLADTGTLSFEGSLVQKFFQKEVTSIPRLSLTIHYDINLFEDLRAFRTLLSHLDKIGFVHLNLSSSGYWDQPALILSARWTYLFAEVMNMVAGKTRGRLSVGHGRSWRSLGKPFSYEHAYTGTSLSPLPPNCLRRAPGKGLFLRGFFRPIFRFMEAILQKLRSGSLATELALGTNSTYKGTLTTSLLLRRPRECNIVLSPIVSSYLEAFHVHSPILWELPFFPWTLYILNNSPLRTLTFFNMDLIHDDWEYILPSITIPTLTSVSFGSANIAFPDLQKFLARHPSIITLDLSKGDAIGYLEPLSSQNLLPCLTRLIAKPEYLIHFLEPPAAFPHLISVSVTCEFDTPLSDFRYQLETVFRLISRRSGDIVLILQFLSQVRLKDWLQLVPKGITSGGLGKVPNVVKLEITAIMPPAQCIFDDLIQFLPLFPSLKHLSISGSLWDALNIEAGQLGSAFWDAFPELVSVNGQARVGTSNRLG